MIMDGKGKQRQYAKERQRSESDLDDKFFLIGILKEIFGMHGITGEILDIPAGGHSSVRCPDVLVRQRVPMLVCELDGPPHGFGDEITTSDQTWARIEDYCRLGNQIQSVIINKELTKQYQRDRVIETLIRQGLAPIIQ